MTANDRGTDNSTVSKGDIVRSPDGRDWRVIDPNDDLNGETFHWMELVLDPEQQRGVGAETVKNDDWEVLG